MKVSEPLLFALTLISAVGCGLMAGVSLASSSFVMTALGRLPPASGITAMQSINIAVINPVFFAALPGTTLTCALLAASSIYAGRHPGAAYLLAV